MLDLRLLRYFVAVAEELNFARAAARLHMSPPPLSRAIKQLEVDLGSQLLLRRSRGVTLTAAGAVAYAQARALLDHAELVQARIRAAAGEETLTVGVLAGSADGASTRQLAAAFRAQHPGTDVRIREADLADPSCGLRQGRADVAITRAPFESAGLTIRGLRSEPVGVVLRGDHPHAARSELTLSELAGHRWFRFPEGTDQWWCDYWIPVQYRDSSATGPVVRTVEECMQAVLWNDVVGLSPIGHPVPAGLVVVPLSDMPPSRLVAAWPRASHSPLVRSFARVAAASYRELFPM